MAIATDGEQALCLADDFAPDTILLDLQLPGLSGVEVLSHIRQDRTRHQPAVIILTGTSFEIEPEEALLAGAQRVAPNRSRPPRSSASCAKCRALARKEVPLVYKDAPMLPTQQRGQTNLELRFRSRLAEVVVPLIRQADVTLGCLAPAGRPGSHGPPDAGAVSAAGPASAGPKDTGKSSRSRTTVGHWIECCSAAERKRANCARRPRSGAGTGTDDGTGGKRSVSAPGTQWVLGAPGSPAGNQCRHPLAPRGRPPSRPNHEPGHRVGRGPASHSLARTRRPSSCRRPSRPSSPAALGPAGMAWSAGPSPRDMGSSLMAAIAFTWPAPPSRNWRTPSACLWPRSARSRGSAGARNLERPALHLAQFALDAPGRGPGSTSRFGGGKRPTAPGGTRWPAPSTGTGDRFDHRTGASGQSVAVGVATL